MLNFLVDTTWAREFLHYYRDLPELWKSDSTEYHNRDLKMKGWDKLLEKFRQAKPSATMDDLKKKINNIRTSYRRELKKVQDSVRSNSEYVHVPRLWYYEDLSFLRDLDQPKSLGTTTVISSDPEPYEIQLVYADGSPMEEEEPAMDEIDNIVEEKPLSRRISHKRKRSKHRYSELKELKEEPVVKQRITSLDHISLSQPQEEQSPVYQLSQQRDEATIYAEAWSVGYRQMNQEQKIYAKKAIDDIINAGLQMQLTPSNFGRSPIIYQPTPSPGEEDPFVFQEDNNTMGAEQSQASPDYSASSDY